VTPTPLARRIAERIRREGPISVADYMALALGDPEHGYYTTREPFGAAGDFVTAPEISQVFGELIGLWCGVVWQGMGAPAPVALIELGPGRGTLMADAMSAAGKVLPAFAAAVALVCVETSSRLRRRQAATLAARHPGARVTWHEDLAAAPGGPALIVANEFLDALPVHQYVRSVAGWCERRVGIGTDGEGLALIDVPIDGAPPALPARLATSPQGSIVELAPARLAVVREIARRVVRDGGAALIIDYGPFASGAGDSLQAVRRHRFQDVLDRPGETDLTSHVDFEAIADAAAAAGAAVFGPLPQGTLLRRLGAEQRLATLSRGRAPGAAAELAAGVRRLIDPKAMGLLFKALALAHPALPTPPGFDPAG
jgi:NADH dehydrogenase [ubiquinone] 1 alpha subcomplex assembly factor 7